MSVTVGSQISAPYGNSTAVLWRARRRLTCLFNAASKAQVHVVTSTVSHYKETANCQHVTFWPRCQCLVHCHIAKPEPHRRVSFDPFPFWRLRYCPNVCVALSMSVSFWLRCPPNVVIYPLNIFFFCTCWCISVGLIATVWMFVLFFIRVFVIRWIFVLLCMFCYSLYVFVIR